MVVKINLDYDSDAGYLLDITNNLRQQSISFFKERFYGDGILSIGIIYNCRPPELKHRLRNRFDKKTKTLYFDIMGDFKTMVVLNDEEKVMLIRKEFQSASQTVLQHKKKIQNFNFENFNEDWQLLFERNF